jgi:hypothetical protein
MHIAAQTCLNCVPRVSSFELSISVRPHSEGPIRRTREGGSEWGLIKILLEGDEGSNKTNTAPNTRLRLTTQIGHVHVATGMLLNLGTNFQPHRPENAVEHQPRVH